MNANSIYFYNDFLVYLLQFFVFGRRALPGFLSALDIVEVILRPALFKLALDQVADGQNGMRFQHPRAAVAHDGADLFAHVGLIAMHLAVGTEGFVLHERAFVAAHVRVVDQRGAVFAGLCGFVVIAAVERNHFGDDALFAGPFGFGIGHAAPPEKERKLLLGW